jgi:hypothetical protein
MFRHEALLYDGPDGFLASTVPFLREGIEAGDPMLVAVGTPKIAALRAALGPDADRVRFEDMTVLGHNPARIIPAWHEFSRVSTPPPTPVRGIGEPIWAGRGATELVECQLHEALLNVAFADRADFRLLCPYDTSALDVSVAPATRWSTERRAATTGTPSGCWRRSTRRWSHRRPRRGCSGSSSTR